MIRILLVEDNTIVREGLELMLQIQTDLEIAGSVPGGRQALTLLENGLEVEVVLTDLNMPDMNGIELTRQICRLGLPCKVIILSMHAKPEFIDKAFSAGAKGYLLKDGEFEEMYEALRHVQRNDFFISSSIRP